MIRYVKNRVRGFLKNLIYESVSEVVANETKPDFQRSGTLSFSISQSIFEKLQRDNALLCRTYDDFLDRVCSKERIEGLNLEFGVFEGTSINALAQRIREPWHGFDSFEGLPEGDGFWKAYFEDKRFDRKGQLPSVEPNVALYKGWFDKTLPKFLMKNPEPVSILHIDCDIYSSTKTIFKNLKPRLKNGSIIIFDEYFNYPGFEQEEYMAFQEFLAESGFDCRFYAYYSKSWQPGYFAKVALILC